MPRKKPKKPKNMAFSNIGSVENESGSISIGSSNPISFAATIPDLAANSIGFVLIGGHSIGTATVVLSSVTWDGQTMTKAIPASNAFTSRTSHIYYLVNPPDNGSKTIVVNFSAPVTAIPAVVHTVVGYADASAVVSLDDSSEGSGTTQNPTIISTQAGANELVISLSTTAANAVSAPSTTDCTELQNYDSGGNCSIAAYSTPASSGDVTHQHNYSQSEVYTITSMSFKEETGVTKSLTDTGSGVDDKPTISASLSRSDVGVGIDNPILAALLGLSDIALGGDLLDLSASVPISEQGSGNDILKEMPTSFILHFERRNDGTPELSDITHNIQPSLSTGTISSVAGKFGSAARFTTAGVSKLAYPISVISPNKGTIS